MASAPSDLGVVDLHICEIAPPRPRLWHTEKPANPDAQASLGQLAATKARPFQSRHCSKIGTFAAAFTPHGSIHLILSDKRTCSRYETKGEAMAYRKNLDPLLRSDDSVLFMIDHYL
ncbi:hypothetical protein [Sphingomonas sanxanigenens]|uniref:hypothetical protein n=1 Tax=Sphingomonas sanxanigenens TaxID=397260 RepID=UPI001301808B|nr:hypothetical protein [Sphingomonas sanxanigenens]